MGISVQTRVGNPGSQATTELGLAFNSLLNLGPFQVGSSSSGLYLLNQGELIDSQEYLREVTFSTTDFGIRNPKHIRFMYLGLRSEGDLVVSVNADERGWQSVVVPSTTDLQRVRVPISLESLGRYWSVRFSSYQAFRVDHVEVQLIVRSSGIIGY
jgi:hypothetical protein